MNARWTLKLGQGGVNLPVWPSRRLSVTDAGEVGFYR